MNRILWLLFFFLEICILSTSSCFAESDNELKPVFYALVVAATEGKAGIHCAEDDDKCKEIVIKNKAMRAIAKRDCDFYYPWPEWRRICAELKKGENKRNKKWGADQPCSSLKEMEKATCELLLEPWQKGVKDFGKKWEGLSVDTRIYEESEQLWAIRIGIVQGYSNPQNDPLKICETYRLKYNVTETSGFYNCWSFACQILFARDPLKVAKAFNEDYRLFYEAEHFPENKINCEEIKNKELRNACINKLGWGRNKD